MVLSGWRLDHSYSLLSGPSPAQKAGGAYDDGGGRRHRGMVHAPSAPRDGARPKPRLSPGKRAAMAEAFRPAVARLFRKLPRPPLQQAFRSAPGRLVCPEPPRGGLRRSGRHMALSRPGLETTVPRLEGTRKAGVCRRTHEETGRQPAPDGFAGQDQRGLPPALPPRNLL